MMSNAPIKNQLVKLSLPAFVVAGCYRFNLPQQFHEISPDNAGKVLPVLALKGFLVLSISALLSRQIYNALCIEHAADEQYQITTTILFPVSKILPRLTAALSTLFGSNSTSQS
jgi:hypothetical protein